MGVESLGDAVNRGNLRKRIAEELGNILEKKGLILRVRRDEIIECIDRYLSEVYLFR